MSDDLRDDPDQPESNLPEPDQPRHPRPELEGPENDAMEAEAASAAAASDTFEQAGGVGIEASEHPEVEAAGEEETDKPAPREAGKLERLQKILAQAGIASRRHAEELITQGRVQVNGQVVTELGSKADPSHDHIRVDGKLLLGSERHRYFMLNKPKGFVTTVSDPEGRPTIMQFFAKMRERLYPVGRLDYMSEGLLLVTNDGELANKLTRAASEVEKTYLVKVSGQPSEEDLERLRQGVPIDRGKPGAGRVHTAPAQILRFQPGKARSERRGGGSRTGDNPWFEVVLIEGRNRELRKMFEEIGHHVEKIRRVGYGPLVLDLEPGKFRELEPEEIEDLRKAADGTLRKPKVRESRRRVLPAPAEHRPERSQWKQREDRGREQRGGYRGQSSQRLRPEGEGGRKPGQFRSEKPFGERRPEKRFEQGRPEKRYGERHSEKPFGAKRQAKPFADRGPERPPRRDGEERAYGGSRERRGTFGGGQGRADRGGSRSFGSRPPRAERPPRGEHPPRREFGESREAESARPERRPFSPDARRGTGRSGSYQDRGERPRFERPYSQERGGRSHGAERGGRPGGEDRGKRYGDRPGRPEGRSSASKAGGFKRGPNPGGNKRGKPGSFGGKSGSVRSGGGRRPGSRPGGKPGGGKRRP
ncbi:MAG TPA: pseudouridine synthase [Acidobacteriaceae bacterium]|nr:pseudouridine synthase [Acidobacteriaceae bacterium]